MGDVSALSRRHPRPGWAGSVAPEVRSGRGQWEGAGREGAGHACGAAASAGLLCGPLRPLVCCPRCAGGPGGHVWRRRREDGAGCAPSHPHIWLDTLCIAQCYVSSCSKSSMTHTAGPAGGGGQKTGAGCADSKQAS